MAEIVRIPMFPLSILPLPGELVPLHIFEMRYRQLLSDMESNDTTFGIFLSHEINQQKVGALMRLESIIKRYPAGESDIIVRCEDVFSLHLLMRKFKDKLYPGGDVSFWKVDVNRYPGPALYDLFLEYLRLRNITQQPTAFNCFQIANELNLDVSERYKFLTLGSNLQENFLQNRIRFQTHLLHQETKSKDVYHLN